MPTACAETDPRFSAHAVHPRGRRYDDKTRRPADLPRCGTRGRQDLRHARRGPSPPRAGYRRGRRARGDPRPDQDRGAARGAGDRAAPIDARPCRARRARHRRRAGPPARGGARRRAGPHQHPRLTQRQALAGRQGAARGRDRRAHHGQRAAPRVAQRRRPADHRGAPAGDRARRRGAPGRTDRAHRHHTGGPAPADGARQRLLRREGRRGARELLPAEQPHRVARTGSALGGR